MMRVLGWLALLVLLVVIDLTMPDVSLVLAIAALLGAAIGVWRWALRPANA